MSEIRNRSGMREIAYRIGDYQSFLMRMVLLANKTPPLDTLNTAAGADFSNALMGAWARVCDVLTFYQERIANEGYLQTAGEAASVVNLVRLLGVARRPAIAAQTHLAAQVIDAKNLPATVLVEPSAALSVQDAPPQGRLPVVFEGSGPIELRSDWNSIALVTDSSTERPQVWFCVDSSAKPPNPPNPPSPPKLWLRSAGLRLAGTPTGVRAGSALLITAQTDWGTHNLLVIADQVQVNRTAGCTLVTWRPDPSICKDETACKQEVAATVTDVVLFRRSAGLFGRSAADWSQLAEAQRIATGVRQGGLLALDTPMSLRKDGAPPDWRSEPGDLPPSTEIRTLAATPAGSLLAGTSSGLYRSTDRGSKWIRAPLVPVTADVHALTCAPDELIYAGAARGMVFASSDDGVSWASLPQAVSTEGGASVWRRLPQFLHLAPERTPLAAPWKLAGTIRAIILIEGTIFLGGDQGVFWMETNSPSWNAFNKGLPQYNSDSGAADVTVHALLFHRDELTAATSAGLFTSRVGKDAWRKSLSAAAAFSLARSADGSTMFAGTDKGVFENADGAWRDIPELSGRSVFALAVTADSLIAATDAGLFWQPHDNGVWIGCDTQDVDLFSVDELFSKDLEKLLFPPGLRAAFERQGLLQATDDVSVMSDPPVWSVVTPPLTTPPPLPGGRRTFHIAPSPTSPARLVVSEALPNCGPAAAILAHDKRLLAATPFGPLLNRDWPDFQIEGGAIFLDRLIDGLDSGGVIVLAPSGRSVLDEPAIYSIISASTAARSAYGKQGTVTRIATTADAQLELFDLRDTIVYLANIQLNPFAPRVASPLPLAGDSLTLANSFDGLGKGRALLVSGPRPAATIVRMGGVFAIDGASASAPAGLAQEAVLALAWTGRAFLAATRSGLVVTRGDDGGWVGAEVGLPPGVVMRVFATDPGNGDRMFAGTSGHGVFERWDSRLPGAPNPGEWTAVGKALAGDTVTALAASSDGIIYAATGNGLFRCSARSALLRSFAPDWSPAGLSGAVHVLAAGAHGCVFAGLDKGRISVLAPGGAWADLPPLPSSGAVRALLVDAHGALFAAGLDDGGIFRRASDPTSGGEWIALDPLPRPAAISALLNVNGKLYAASRGAGAFVWVERDGWKPALASVSNDVLALACNEAGAVLAGCNAAVCLSVVEPRCLERAVVAQAALGAAIAALDQQTAPPGLRQTLAGAGVKLSAAAAVTVVERGERWLLRDGDGVWVVERPLEASPGAQATLRIVAADLVEVAAGPLDIAGAGNWTITLDGASVDVMAQPDEIVWQPPRSNQTTISEIVFVDGVASRTGDQMVLTLSGPLRHCYSAAQARICANMVRVTQGETVTDEVLGSGDHTQAWQRFTLRRSPLTHTRDDDSAVAYSTLRVEVNSRATRALRFGAGSPPSDAHGEHWRHTPALVLASPDARAYMTEIDDQGRTIVRFGDGTHGSRLPTGTENVTASYRVGAGSNGNVEAGTLIALRKRPLGIRSVTNPVAAHGGRDAESTEALRRRAPRQSTPFDRVVAFEDYAYFAGGFPGVAAVKVQILPGAKAETICVWIVPDIGHSMTPSPHSFAALKEALHKAIEQNRADALPLYVGGFKPVRFRIAVHVDAKPDANPATLKTRVEAALIEAFSLVLGTYGEPIAPDQVEAMLCQLLDVADAKVQAMHLAGRAPSQLETLKPKSARWDAGSGQFISPEALFTDPSGIVVTVDQQPQ